MSNPTPTARLYYDDSYLTHFEADVVEQTEGGLRVYLDRTAFYPTSGGQPFDTGWLAAPGSADNVEVVDVIDEGERIAHVLATPLLGARVTGRVHFARRFDHMQQHSGQHLLSAVFQELTGLVTIGVHFGDVSSTLDLEGSPTSEQLRAVEARANVLVFENRPVSAAIEEQAEGLRKASTREGPLRIVSIGELDRSACGGTHVRATGEIGPVLLRRLERVRKATRVEFVCGMRAVQRARADQEALSQLGALLSTGLDQVPQVVSARLAELKETSGALRDARTALAGYRAHELYRSAAPPADDAGGLHWHLERHASISVDELRGVGQAYSALPRAVFVGASENPAQILLATSEDSGLHAGNSLKAALAAAQGKGGGSPRLAQGSVSDGAALERALEELSLLRSKVQAS
ncbi:MAG: alanine--tRNA ligase-related protein [Polyangiaceae bacterium]